jgi:hypothetical protein
MQSCHWGRTTKAWRMVARQPHLESNGTCYITLPLLLGGQRAREKASNSLPLTLYATAFQCAPMKQGGTQRPSAAHPRPLHTERPAILVRLPPCHPR